MVQHSNGLYVVVWVTHDRSAILLHNLLSQLCSWFISTVHPQQQSKTKKWDQTAINLIPSNTAWSSLSSVSYSESLYGHTGFQSASSMSAGSRKIKPRVSQRAKRTEYMCTQQHQLSANEMYPVTDLQYWIGSLASSAFHGVQLKMRKAQFSTNQFMLRT